MNCRIREREGHIICDILDLKSQSVHYGQDMSYNKDDFFFLISALPQNNSLPPSWKYHIAPTLVKSRCVT